MKHSVIKDLRTDLVARIKAQLAVEAVANARMGAIPVTSEGTKDVTEIITNSLTVVAGQNSRIGLAILVAFPRARRPDPNIAGAPGDLKPSVFVLCEPTLNEDATTGTEIAPETLAHFICSHLHQLKVNADTSPLIGDENAIQPANIEGVSVAYEMPFYCRDVTSDPVNQCASVVMAQITGPKIQMTCATAGASIYFTTDGTVPVPGNSSTTLYSAAVDLPVGSTTYRAMAMQAGYLGSDDKQQTFTNP